MTVLDYLAAWWRSVRWPSRRWFPLLFWMAAIFYFSHQPAPDLPDYGVWDVLVKKSSHFLAYAVLASLAFRVSSHRPYLRSLVLTTSYALSDETHQLFIAGRNGRLSDVFIDLAGGLTALLLIFLVLRSRVPVVGSSRDQPDFNRSE